ncbi:MAG: hypothetical protein ACO3HN_00985 [Opitutales bacterium]
MSDPPYHLAERGVGVGVLTSVEVVAGLATGRLAASTLSWREGEAAWMPLGARPEFVAAVGAFRTLVPPPALAFEASVKAWPGWSAWAQTMRAIWRAPRAVFRSPVGDSARGRSVVWLLVAAFLVAPFLYAQLAYTGGAASEIITARILSGAPAIPPSSLDLGRLAAFLVGFPLAMPAAAFGGACLMHAVLVMFGGGKAGLRVTFRVVAYVVGAMLMTAIIPCGWLLAPLLALAYLSVALPAAHRESAWKSVLALAVAGFGAGCVAVAFMALAVWPFFRPMG